jgi:hypothetical protein
MTNQGVASGARSLANLLIGHIVNAGLVSLQALADDPVAALEADPAARISWVEPESLPAGCSIAARLRQKPRPRTPSHL